MTSDHSLWIKQRQGLGRGTEQYMGELYLNYKNYLQAFIGYGLRDFSLSSTADGLYASTAKSEQRTTARISVTAIKKLELGLNLSHTLSKKDVGLFGRFGMIKNHYILAQYDVDLDRLEGIGYVRTGYFVFRGLDVFVGYEYATGLTYTFRQSAGFLWMVRPRLELDGSAIQSEQGLTLMGQVHIWM